MNDNQIVEYCRKLVTCNLNQYVDENPGLILSELYNLQNDKTNKELLGHCKGLKELLEKGISILENKKNVKNK